MFFSLMPWAIKMGVPVEGVQMQLEREYDVSLDVVDALEDPLTITELKSAQQTLIKILESR
jgi:hypothetical protein